MSKSIRGRDFSQRFSPNLQALKIHIILFSNFTAYRKKAKKRNKGFGHSNFATLIQVSSFLYLPLPSVSFIFSIFAILIYLIFLTEILIVQSTQHLCRIPISDFWGFQFLRNLSHGFRDCQDPGGKEEDGAAVGFSQFSDLRY